MTIEANLGGVLITLLWCITIAWAVFRFTDRK